MITRLNEEADQLCNQLVLDLVNENLIVQYSSKSDQIHSMLRKIVVTNDQPMKANWLTKGDKPTSFFYNRVHVPNPKRRSNIILNTYGTWSSASDKLAYEAINYFTAFFSSS